MSVEGFAARIRQLRYQKKITQADLADALEMHPIHVGRYERGDSEPRLPILVKLAKIFDVSVDYLLLGTDRAGIEDKDLLMLFREVEHLDPYDRIALKKLMGDFMIERGRIRDL